MKKTVLALTLLTALPFAASAAEGVSYNYAEAGYVYTDVNSGSSRNNTDGWAIKGSVAVAPNFHVFGDYSNQDMKSNLVTGIDQWRLGVGYNHEIAQRVDLLTRVAYQKYDSGYYKFNGYSAEVGAAASLNDMFSGYVLAGYEDYGSNRGYNPDGEFYGRVGAQAKFTPNWAVSGEVKLGKAGAREWFIGPRFTW